MNLTIFFVQLSQDSPEESWVRSGSVRLYTSILPFKLVLPKDFVAKLNVDQQAKLKAFAKEHPALAQTAFAAMNKVVSNLKKVADIASKGIGH